MIKREVAADWFIHLYDTGSWKSLIKDDNYYFGHYFFSILDNPFEITDTGPFQVFFAVKNREFVVEYDNGEYELYEV